MTFSSGEGRFLAHFLFSPPRILRKLLTAAKRYGIANAWKINALRHVKLLTVPYFFADGRGSLGADRAVNGWVLDVGGFPCGPTPKRATLWSTFHLDQPFLLLAGRPMRWFLPILTPADMKARLPGDGPLRLANQGRSRYNGCRILSLTAA